MRVEHDSGGVSVFLEADTNPLEVLFSGLGVPGWVFVGFGLLQTLAGLAWAGPALVFVGIVLLISVPLAFNAQPREACDHLRIDHRGVRLGSVWVGEGASVQQHDEGLTVRDAERTYWLPVREAQERERLATMLRIAFARVRPTGEVPVELAALVRRHRA
ncbi:MAG: hypothetical protein H6734_01145 [Alphaproteobacteria bacterium]|nr:hypothetical protein [Alphaproteobacteria bacterium]